MSMLPLLELNVAKLSVHQTSISMDADGLTVEQLQFTFLPLLNELAETMDRDKEARIVEAMKRIVNFGSVGGLSAPVNELLTGFLNRLIKKKPSLASNYDFIVSISKMEPKLLLEVDWDPLVVENLRDNL